MSETIKPAGLQETSSEFNPFLDLIQKIEGLLFQNPDFTREQLLDGLVDIDIELRDVDKHDPDYRPCTIEELKKQLLSKIERWEKFMESFRAREKQRIILPSKVRHRFIVDNKVLENLDSTRRLLQPHLEFLLTFPPEDRKILDLEILELELKRDRVISDARRECYLTFADKINAIVKAELQPLSDEDVSRLAYYQALDAGKSPDVKGASPIDEYQFLLRIADDYKRYAGQ